MNILCTYLNMLGTMVLKILYACGILLSREKAVARTFGASVTPEVFLLDRRGIIRYRGAIDDRPNEPQAVTTHYLKDAIVQILAGEAIATSSTEPIGSPIEFRQP